jgi:amino acid permease
MSFIVIIIVVMITINQGAGAIPVIGIWTYPSSVPVYETDAAGLWSAKFITSLSIAAFTFVGVDIPAVSAFEARIPAERRPGRGAIGRTVKVSALWGIPFIPIFLYVLANSIYVTSRLLYSLTRGLDGKDGVHKQPICNRVLAWSGRTNNRKVPMSALVFSCIFSFIPFLCLSPSNRLSTSITTTLNHVSEMGSVGVLIVWACQCWSFIRFRH